MRFWRLSVLLLAAFAGSVLADQLDDAEAKRRGVSVDTVQLEAARTRIETLEKKVVELQKENSTLRAGTTAPPTAAAPAITQPAGEVSELMKQLYTKGEAVRVEKLVQARKELQQTQAQKYGNDYEAKKAHQDRVSEKLSTIKMLESVKGIYIPELGFPVMEGMAGTLHIVNIMQVLDDHTALCHVYGDEVFLLKGFSTTGMVDGRGTILDWPILVSGTHKYVTVNGSSNTILVIEKITRDTKPAP